MVVESIFNSQLGRALEKLSPLKITTRKNFQIIKFSGRSLTDVQFQSDNSVLRGEFNSSERIDCHEFGEHEGYQSNGETSNQLYAEKRS
jgi:hypothetical protein